MYDTSRNGVEQFFKFSFKDYLINYLKWKEESSIK
jgi:hypothetical protein